MASKTTRREFLKATTTAAVGATLGLPTILMAGQGRGKPRFAIVGAGGRGGANLESAARLGVVTAICDIDANTRAKAMAAHPDAATFDDFRSMIERMHKEFDGVVVSTPDHTHTPAAALALHFGKHVYVE
jgi:predicted dehydrogenase